MLRRKVGIQEDVACNIRPPRLFCDCWTFFLTSMGSCAPHLSSQSPEFKPERMVRLLTVYSRGNKTKTFNAGPWSWQARAVPIQSYVVCLGADVPLRRARRVLQGGGDQPGDKAHPHM